MSERFGEVRSILNQGESATNWTRLCDVVDGFDPGELDQMVFPYVAGHVREWNPRTCVAPREWVYRALLGEELPFWSMVRKLDLSLEYLDSTKLLTLLASSRMAQIEVMNLESNRIGAAGAQVIAEAEHLGQIQELRLGFNHLKLAGMLWLNRADSLDALRHLYIHDNSLGDLGTGALAKATFLTQLETLDLSVNEVGVNALVGLLDVLDGSQSIRQLVLNHNPMGKGTQAMQRLAKGFAQLEVLDLRGCELEDAEVRTLGKKADWSCLRNLDLSRNHKVRDGALNALLGEGEFPKLERVYLGGTLATHGLFEALNTLRALKYVEMPEAAVRSSGMGALRERGVRLIAAR